MYFCEFSLLAIACSALSRTVKLRSLLMRGPSSAGGDAGIWSLGVDVETVSDGGCFGLSVDVGEVGFVGIEQVRPR